MQQPILFALQLAATLYMTGLIWFVQVVHYPLFQRVGADQFLAYEQAHTRLTTYVVAPVMLLELATAVLLLWVQPKYWLWWVNLGGIGLLWASTFFIQVPLHTALSQAPDLAAMQRLATSNWIRTALWTLRAGLLLWFLIRAVRGL